VIRPTASIQPLSHMFNKHAAAAAVAAMSPVGSPAPSDEDRGTATVDPITKDNLSTRGKATAWKNPVAGQSTFMSWGDDSRPAIPQPDSGAY